MLPQVAVYGFESMVGGDEGAVAQLLSPVLKVFSDKLPKGDAQRHEPMGGPLYRLAGICDLLVAGFLQGIESVTATLVPSV